MSALRPLRLVAVAALIASLGWTVDGAREYRSKEGQAPIPAEPASLNEPCQLKSSPDEASCQPIEDCASLGDIEKFRQPLKEPGLCAVDLVCCPLDSDDSGEDAVGPRLLAPQNRRSRVQSTRLFPSSETARRQDGARDLLWGSGPSTGIPSWNSQPSSWGSSISAGISPWNSIPSTGVSSWNLAPSTEITSWNSQAALDSWGASPASGISLWNSQPIWSSRPLSPQQPTWGSRPSTTWNSEVPTWGSRPVTRPTPTTSAPESPGLPSPPSCGVMLSDRIHGGNLTAPDEFPWTARLEYSTPSGKGYYCGGSLIADRWVLTAAHCVTGRAVRPGWRVVAVRLGEWNEETNPDCTTLSNGLRDCAPEPVDVRVSRWVAHPQFDSLKKNVPNDIALLLLERRVRSTQFVRPICLPTSAGDQLRDYAGATAIVTGWGRTEHNNQPSPVKLKAALTVWPVAECWDRFHDELTLSWTQQVCAGGVRGVDACQGDSGGPLMVEREERALGLKVYQLLGIVSIGRKQCGSGGFPGIYTRVAAYIPWIKQTLAQHQP